MNSSVFKSNNCEIIKMVTGGQWKQNCYLIKHVPSNEMLIVDPGGDAESISKTIHLNDGIVKCILLTHAHHDHIGAVKELCDAYAISCYLQKADARLLRMAPVYAARFTGKMITAPDNVNLYIDLPEIAFGKRKISAILTPGHTAGSVCYLFDGFLFTGDTLLFEHVGRTDLPGGNAHEISRSVSQLLNMNFENMALFPGHGRPWSMEEAKNWWERSNGCPPEYNQFEK